ncbi:MAG: GWxTD domain-containing protein [Candidatus Aminicenantes bacterium]|nr:GWxTD domain-containing protein [Candidatus Aminicenantes bacterium]
MKKVFIVLALISLLAACSSKAKIRVDPFYESFYEKTRLIMSKEEKEIYKHLPGKEAKAEFIADFWKKRDPTPDTEDNEIKEEFEERITYANKWFNENKSKHRGWDTARGRILLQLGFPEERHWGEIDDINRSRGTQGELRTTQRMPMEMWLYYRYQLSLTFAGDRHGFNTFKLIRVPTVLGTVLEQAKRRLDLGTDKPKKNAFKFTAHFQKDNIKITVPVKRISFSEAGDTMNAEFRVQVYVYLNYERIDEITDKMSVSKDKEELLNIKNISYVIPYSPERKGSYYFDVIVTDEASAAKYRNFCKYKK